MQIADVLGAELETIGPKPNSTHGSPVESARVVFEDDNVEVGIWEITPGGFASTKDGISEVMHFVSGAGTITSADGIVTEIGPGVVLVTPDGWSGVWDVREPTRKTYTIVKTTS
jgi:uncharacterized protein